VTIGGGGREERERKEMEEGLKGESEMRDRKICT
jgi:hypothetical protein